MKRSRISPISAAKRADIKRQTVGYMVVSERAAGRCEAQLDCCTGAHEETHHRLPKKTSSVRNENRHDPSILLAVCRACHRHIEANRAEAYESGHLIRRSADRFTTEESPSDA